MDQHMTAWEAIRREWLPGDMRSHLAAEVIVDGMAAARRLLGREWPEKAAEGIRAPTYLSMIVSIGLRLDSIAHLPGVGQLVTKIVRDGLRSSARAELAVAAALHARGIHFEIEPPVPKGERPPDCRASVDGHAVDIQVVQPEISQVEWGAWMRLGQISGAIYSARTEELLVEALVAWPINPATELKMFQAAAGEPAAAPGTHIVLPGIGDLWISEIPLASEAFTRVEPPAGNGEGAYLSGTVVPGARRLVTIETRIPGSGRLLKKLEKKRDQLRKDGRGLIVLDVTGIPDGLRVAQPLVPELFRQSGRVGAVVLLEEDDGRILSMANPQARNPLPGGFVDTLERGLRELIR